MVEEPDRAYLKVNNEEEELNSGTGESENIPCETANQEQVWNYVIGDIHGCYDELLQLEEKINFHAINNGVKSFIISVGDLIDRGPKSNEVVEHFRNGITNGSHTAVMGNHELLMLEALQAFAPENFSREGCTYPDWFQTYKSNFEKGQGASRFIVWKDFMVTTRSMWMSQGGFNTLKSYGCDPNKAKTWQLPPEHIAFLINLPFLWENDSFIITHALAVSDDLKSVKSFIPLLNTHESEKLNEEQVENLRNSVVSLIWNRTIPKLRPDEHKNHISGHTPFKNVKRHNRINCLQIDTACVFGGRLSAICLETDKIISVKAKKNYLN